MQGGHVHTWILLQMDLFSCSPCQGPQTSLGVLPVCSHTSYIVTVKMIKLKLSHLDFPSTGPSLSLFLLSGSVPDLKQTNKQLKLNVQRHQQLKIHSIHTWTWFQKNLFFCSPCPCPQTSLGAHPVCSHTSYIVTVKMIKLKKKTLSPGLSLDWPLPLSLPALGISPRPETNKQLKLKVQKYQQLIIHTITTYTA